MASHCRVLGFWHSQPPSFVVSEPFPERWRRWGKGSAPHPGRGWRATRRAGDRRATRGNPARLGAPSPRRAHAVRWPAAAAPPRRTSRVPRRGRPVPLRRSWRRRRGRARVVWCPRAPGAYPNRLASKARCRYRVEGVEPSTVRLTVGCSATELHLPESKLSARSVRAGAQSAARRPGIQNPDHGNDPQAFDLSRRPGVEPGTARPAAGPACPLGQRRIVHSSVRLGRLSPSRPLVPHRAILASPRRAWLRAARPRECFPLPPGRWPR